jgi:hypothetical protein
MQDKGIEHIKTEWAASTKNIGELIGYVDARIKVLEEKEQALAEAMGKAKAYTDALSSKIVLDVGGTKFTTSKSTLLSYKGSFFDAMLSSGCWKPDSDGVYFIDRDPKHFPLILNFLRMGKVVGHIDADSMDELEAELDFYQIQFPIILGGDAKSKLLDEEKTQQIIKWIGRPVNGLRLLYSATRDGFRAEEFHNKCDAKGPTVVVVKSDTSLFGGYAAHSWDRSGKYINSPTSFLFTLVNSHRLPPTKFKISDDGAVNAMRCIPRSGPTFGGGYDLHISDNSNSNNESYTAFPFSYEDKTGIQNFTFANTLSFQTDDIEVFSVD